MIDGLALEPGRPVLVHAYDPPAGGKWVDDVIPGRLAAHDAATGATLWTSPCEVGYGRGFGAGFGADADALVLGPSIHGHRAVRMSIATGELLDARDIEPFDEAVVQRDLCHVVAPGRITALSSSDLFEVWSHGREGERYHSIARLGERLFAVYSSRATGRQGVHVLDAASGELRGELFEAELGTVHCLAVGGGAVSVVASDPSSALCDALSDPRGPDLVERVAGREDALVLVTVSGTAEAGDLPRACDVIEGDDEELPDVEVRHDGRRLFVARGTSLDVRDLETGEPLGDLAVPGLDERVCWEVGGGLLALAEETRVSIFDVPEVAEPR